MKVLKHIVPVALAMALLPAAFSVGATETGHREHSAHEHGHGTLSIVIDGPELVIELEMPGINVVGFEHAPNDEAQQRSVDEAIALFKRSNLIFVPTAAANCRARDAEVTMAGGEQHDGEVHAVGEHAKDDKSGLEHEKGELHTELHAEYRFHCKAPAELQTLEVRLFEHLTNVHDIDVQIVTPTLQTATELGADDTLIRLVAD